jgi:hypothetical protein
VLFLLTKNATVMLLIVLAEAALRWNFVFWSYFVVIFRVGVDVHLLYRRAIRTFSLGLFDLQRPLTIHNMVHWVAFSLLKKANNFFTNFWHSRDKSDFLPILQKMQNITIIYERKFTENCSDRLDNT